MKGKILKLVFNFNFSIYLVFLLSYLSFSQSLDSVNHSKKWHKGTVLKTIAVPVILIGYGVSTIGNHGLFYSSRDAQKDVTNLFPGFHTHVDDLLVYAPLASVYGINLSGIKGRHNYADITILYALSLAASTAVTTSLKYSTHILRPDNSTYNSFPSGHTSSVFVAAELMHQEYKDESIWYSVAGYTIGIATGALRMMNNRHWISDVFAGAGIGILTTKITYLYYPWFQQKVLKNKTKSLGFMPMFYGKGGAAVSFVYIIE